MKPIGLLCNMHICYYMQFYDPILCYMLKKLLFLVMFACAFNIILLFVMLYEQMQRKNKPARKRAR